MYVCMYVCMYVSIKDILEGLKLEPVENKFS
jgi:hypothetical protein